MYSLKIHLKGTHEKKRQLKCNEWNHSTSQYGNLKEHLIRRHRKMRSSKHNGKNVKNVNLSLRELYENSRKRKTWKRESI